MEKEMYIIELQNVSKSFDDTLVVENVNLQIKKGEFVTLLGPSGCGKTTTLRMIAGFELPSSGNILLNGKDISKLPPYKRPINTVFQKYALFSHLNIFENIAFGLKLKRIPVETVDKNGQKKVKQTKLSKQEIAEKVRHALRMVDLEGFEKRNITTLSGGQQQRIAIARAIVNEPEILLLDEPLGALDLKMRKEMQLELKEMHRRIGITFIYVTHDQEEALTMSDTIVVMNDGNIQQVGTPKGIYDEPANAFVADFIGESNIYSGTMFPDHQVKFLGKLFPCVDAFEIHEKVDVVVRPEDVKIVKLGEGIVDGIIQSKIFKGVHYEYLLMVGRSELVAQSTKEYTLNQTVGVTVHPQNIHIMPRVYASNQYDGYINKNYQVCFAEGTFDCDLTQLYPKGQWNEDDVFVDEKGNEIDCIDQDVRVEIGFDGIEISDNLEEGQITGNILQLIYKGDHYQIVVRTDDEEDFVLDSPYLWNENDRVAIHIASSNIKLTLKTEDKKHEKH